MAEKIIHWGIIGMGKIARKFAADLQRVPGARLSAVASTAQDRADAFAQEFGATYAYGRYEDIVKCPALDVVYIATPHVYHTENAIMCMENGISVLCEKPFAMNLGEARRMVDTARRNRVFLMEAFWTAFIPAVEFALDMAARGEIGRVHTATADFGFKALFDPQWRLYNKSLGGGSLLDIGIYPAFLALSLFGKPASEHILAAATFTATDVDESCAFTFAYPDKCLMMGHSTIAAHTPIEARIYGTEGSITLHTRWHQARQITISRYDETGAPHHETKDFPYEGWGYHFEAAHVTECIQSGLLESDRMTLDRTLDLTETLDAIREKIGLTY